MQIASRQCLWDDGIWTVIEVEMTRATGLYLRFIHGGVAGKPSKFVWGDGTVTTRPYSANNDQYVSHTYPHYGRYTILARGVGSIGFRSLDGQSQYAYDAAILSFVDRTGDVTGSRSAAFKKAVNLKRFVAPNAVWMGQRDFAYCSSLEEVVIGEVGIYYDGTFQNCTKLSKFETKKSWTCWSYVWQGCTSLTELKLGDVEQFATQDFKNTPRLKDIWIANKTVDQILQKASAGNIVAGYGAKFPWGASKDCRFHGTDGVVLGSGIRIS